jgi:hypothetical protein
MRPNHPLIEDLFHDVLSDDLRARLLAETLRAAHRRIWRRRVTLAALPLAALLVALLILRPAPRPNTGEAVAARRPSVFIVSSTPLPDSMIVRTRQDAVELIETGSTALAIVQTPDGARSVQEISDGQLLALLAGRPAAIVRASANDRRAQLLLLDPEDSRSMGLP